MKLVQSSSITGYWETQSSLSDDQVALAIRQTNREISKIYYSLSHRHMLIARFIFITTFRFIVAKILKNGVAPVDQGWNLIHAQILVELRNKFRLSDEKIAA